MQKISEDTLNDVLSEIFMETGFHKIAQATLEGNKQPDHLLEYKGTKIISETEMGNYSVKLSMALKQLYNYNSQLHWDNSIVIIFPESARQSISIYNSEEALRDIVKRTNIEGIYQIKGKAFERFEKGNIYDLIKVIKEIIEKDIKKPEIDFNTVVEALRKVTEEFSMTLREQKIGDQVYETPVGSFELFTAIAEEDDADWNTSLIDLLAYIFINQLLFYHILSLKNTELSPLKEIDNIQEILIRFNHIQTIDFKAIYDVNVVAMLPRNIKIIEEVNNIIRHIINLPIDKLEHDILGRFFHDLLPHKTRKILAAFYTRPQSAEILSMLSIDSENDLVIDPACGSGTLLVSAYKRKKELLKHDKKDYHKRFIENDLYGIDIMPFAVHLTSLNLSLQNIEDITDRTLTAVGDSLLDLPSIYLRESQKIITGIMDTLTKHTIDSSTEKYETISIKPNSFDLVLMNPPFTKMERLPKAYRNNINKTWSGWGQGIGMWGKFLGLAYEYLLKKDGGKIAAVIPIAIFRGRETDNLRNIFFADKSEINLTYVVKALKNLAFSESSIFRDVLTVFELNTKRKYCAFVFIKKDIGEISIKKARLIGKRIKGVKENIVYDDDDFSVKWVGLEKIKESKNNIMFYLNVITPKNTTIISNFVNMLKENPLFTLADNKLIIEAWGPRPKGINKVLIVTRPSKDPNDISRIKNAYLILVNENDYELKVQIKNTEIYYTIPRNCVLPSLRTATGINRIHLNDNDLDYLIIDSFEGFDQLIKISGFKHSINWEDIKSDIFKSKTKAVITSRMRWDSENNYFCSFLSDNYFYPTNQLKCVKAEDYFFQTVVFNSIISLLQLYIFKEDSTENFIHIHGQDMSYILLPTFNQLSDNQKQLINQLLHSILDIEFPNLLYQITRINKHRLYLDTELFKILGIDFEVKKLYRALSEEIEINYRIK